VRIWHHVRVLLIWGIRRRSKVIDRGLFFCPHCGGDRQYARKQARRWFTFFFIPIIPLKVLGEFVECETCRTAYKLEVLSTPTTAGMLDQLTSAIREMVVQVVRAAPDAIACRASALAVLSESTGRAWTDAELDVDLASVDVTNLPARLTALAGTLTEQGKESFLGSTVRVAAPTGTLDAGMRPVVDGIAASLSMTPAHARGVIDSTVERLRSS
jgi:hypothetical protein